ncbi:succinate dehydrogenase/fumarate reductase iron-sulfur subunit [Nitratiruptor sp. YY09-18]|uniref:succinate dehydrogenase/fumarate reductase iron-sulfur subunit n=1 Tax=Nitratiruptor sp. YY09-18 TaxID=2724901 RepID=UPI001916BD9A|nr:2Fe-2S iron-sulfur cluster-binding protein [Nitratiruptor sp. YY09-18]BCD67137.1 fumarate reductase iron-sulfur subunit [Nitratiruptor sp. YY09-18]
MKIKVRRYHPHFAPPTIEMEYDIPQDVTLLQALSHIKRHIDRTLTFSFMCRSGVCGSCAMRVNGKEVLACEYKVQENDIIEPLQFTPTLRDLVSDKKSALETLERSKAYPLNMEEVELEQADIAFLQRQSDCILCSSCYSSCPVYEVNEAFLGPFALTRVYRYVCDKREQKKKEHIDAIVENGIWDCTLCGNCTEVCPQGIDPKNDILMLQSWAAKFGYTNPHMGSFGSFGLEF